MSKTRRGTNRLFLWGTFFPLGAVLVYCTLAVLISFLVDFFRVGTAAHRILITIVVIGLVLALVAAAIFLLQKRQGSPAILKSDGRKTAAFLALLVPALVIMFYTNVFFPLNMLPVGILCVMGERENHLSLSHNKLASLPESIGRLTSLNHLSLSHNKLASLPESIVRLEGLETLYMEGNDFGPHPDSVKIWLAGLHRKGCEMKT